MKYLQRTLITLIIFVTRVTYAQDNTYTVPLLGYFDTTSVMSELTSLGYVEGQDINYVFPFIAEWETMSPEELMVAYQQAYEEVARSPEIDIVVTNTDTDAVNVLPLLHDPTTPI